MEKKNIGSDDSPMVCIICKNPNKVISHSLEMTQDDLTGTWKENPICLDCKTIIEEQLVRLNARAGSKAQEVTLMFYVIENTLFLVTKKNKIVESADDIIKKFKTKKTISTAATQNKQQPPEKTGEKEKEPVGAGAGDNGQPK